jgi:hypothetical protein
MVAGDSAFRIASGRPLEGHLVSAHRPPPTDLSAVLSAEASA